MLSTSEGYPVLSADGAEIVLGPVSYTHLLFAPNNKIYDSYEITYKEYKDEYLPDSAIECFKKPWLW